MVLLTFALLGISAMAWKGVYDDCKKASANSRVQRERYYLSKHFEEVLRCSNVRRKKQDGYKYLPADGWKSCITYLKKQPYITDKDITEFINHYEKVRKEELDNIQQHWNEEYQNARQEYLSSSGSAQEFVFEKKFYAFFDHDFVQELADELYSKTFMHDMAVKRPKVVGLPDATNNAYVMIWVLRCPGGSYKAKEFFKACCRYLGKPID